MAIHHDPNDILSIDSGTLYGDGPLTGTDYGGNDTLYAEMFTNDTSAFVFGDTYNMGDNTHGGNDYIQADLDAVQTSATLYGDAFNLYGHAIGGIDTLTASNNPDYGHVSLYGDANVMKDNAVGGNDVLMAINDGYGSSSVLSGDANVMQGTAHGGDDTLTAYNYHAQQTATLYGDAASMGDYSKGGNDNLLCVNVGNYPATGANSTAILIGDADTMTGHAAGGNDVLDGSYGNETLYGDARVYTPASPGSIKGGKDTLIAGPNDQLWGGPNNDTFKFAPATGVYQHLGSVTVEDFNQGNKAVGSATTEHDVLNVHPYAFANWNALHALISDNADGNAVVHLAPTDSVTLVGVHTAALHASDFIL
jgi:hypothetical protein